jgi:hypothetical protein
MFWTGIFLRTEILREYSTWLNFLYIATDWMFCTGIFPLIEYFVLEYSYCLKFYRNIPIDWIFCTGIFLLAEYCFTGIFLITEYFVYPYWLNVLYWNIPANWMFCTGISILTEIFVLEYPYPPGRPFPRRRTRGGNGCSAGRFQRRCHKPSPPSPPEEAGLWAGQRWWRGSYRKRSTR